MPVDYDAVDKAYEIAARHAQSCRKCGRPIVDDEGNPGTLGDACPVGLKLLVAYMEATGDFVPPWAKRGSLRSRVIRLASENAALRPLLLPLLRT